MAEFFAELERLFGALALQPDITAIALTADASTFLLLTDDVPKYAEGDAWVSGFDAKLQRANKRGSLVARACCLARTEVVFLLGDTSWAIEASTVDAKDLAPDLFEIYDPRELIRNLRNASGAKQIGFAKDEIVKQYADVSSDFFRIIGLGERVFISDTSTLADWCNVSNQSVEHANARILEAYGVDVSDLNGGLLIDVFERIRHGEHYCAWKAEQER